MALGTSVFFYLYDETIQILVHRPYVFFFFFLLEGLRISNSEMDQNKEI